MGKVAVLKDRGELCLLSAGRSDSRFNPTSSREESLAEPEGRAGQGPSAVCREGGSGGWEGKEELRQYSIISP